METFITIMVDDYILGGTLVKSSYYCITLRLPPNVPKCIEAIKKNNLMHRIINGRHEVCIPVNPIDEVAPKYLLK